MEDSIKIKLSEENIFTAKFESGAFEEEGNGLTAREAVEDLFYKIDLNQMQSEEEKIKLFISKNIKPAKKIAIDLFNILGPDFFTISEFKNKTGLSREESDLRLDFLINFGLVQADREKGAGQRFKIILDSQTLQQHYFNESEKWQATAKYYKALSDELSNLDNEIEKETLDESEK